MKIFVFGLIALIVMTLPACSLLCDRLMFPRPKNSAFDYYNPRYRLPAGCLLNTDGCYYTTWSGHDGSTGYTYLVFRSQGTVLYLSNTAMLPDSFLICCADEALRFNGRPKDRREDFGFYQVKEDSIFFNIHRVVLFGGQHMHDFKGKIYRDSIVLNTDVCFLHHVLP